MKALIEKMRRMALSELRRMYEPAARLCSFRIKRCDGGIVMEGISRRYTAIALIGLAGAHVDEGPGIFHGESCADVCGRLLSEAPRWSNLGDTALTLWAARELGHPRASAALEHIRKLDPVKGIHPTVELAWTLTALSVCGTTPLDAGLAEAVADRLLGSFRKSAGMFPHMPPGSPVSWLREHIVCFADLVYPIQALSNYGTLVGRTEAVEAARITARGICDRMGRQGQWWWHYDLRTGRIVEGYPVYAVHQDAMAPMALFAAQDASGEDFGPGVARGLDWLVHSPEINGSLIDDAADVIWRKVARREPGKVSRGIQAAASRLHPALRMPLVGSIFRPNWVDYESRPYHMGWILYAWSPKWTARFLKRAEGNRHDGKTRSMAGTASL